jgi:CRISPR/Cas system Type II protein with McrA/HNH and RuvC-like nuclease domain
VIPKSRGGSNEWTNLVTCCSKCNRDKDNKTPDEAKMTMNKPAYEPPIMYDDVELLNVWTDFQKSFV